PPDARFRAPPGRPAADSLRGRRGQNPADATAEGAEQRLAAGPQPRRRLPRDAGAGPGPAGVAAGRRGRFGLDARGGFCSVAPGGQRARVSRGARGLAVAAPADEAPTWNYPPTPCPPSRKRRSCCVPPSARKTTAT